MLWLHGSLESRHIRSCVSHWPSGSHWIGWITVYESCKDWYHISDTCKVLDQTLIWMCAYIYTADNRSDSFILVVYIYVIART